MYYTRSPTRHAFDAVLMANVLCRLPDPKAALEGIAGACDWCGKWSVCLSNVYTLVCVFYVDILVDGGSAIDRQSLNRHKNKSKYTQARSAA